MARLQVFRSLMSYGEYIAPLSTFRHKGFALTSGLCISFRVALTACKAHDPLSGFSSRDFCRQFASLFRSHSPSTLSPIYRPQGLYFCGRREATGLSGLATSRSLWLSCLACYSHLTYGQRTY